MGVLRKYRAALGRLIQQYEGSLERFTGDSLMVFFKHSVFVADPAERAVRMALAIRHAGNEPGRNWHRRGIKLWLAIGIAEGYATIRASLSRDGSITAPSAR